jgi:Helicase conserved C-terminal domain/DEAD/DEAH box helicase
MQRLARVAVWHGDIAASVKHRLAADPPDILLTTPESLEGMLISGRVDHSWAFGSLQAVIVDELHAFAGDDRGWHLLGVLARLARLAGHRVQRIGLSATIGNPAPLLDWLADGSESRRIVVNPPAGSVSPADVQLDHAGSVKNAAIIIARLHQGSKRLVFCDSRTQVEQLAAELRDYGVQTYVSHSSLSADTRRQTETAFATATNCVIVATSTLELGVDIGDLDHVIQVDTPASVASFLQRLGRTGRRTGSVQNATFITTRPQTLWSTGAHGASGSSRAKRPGRPAGPAALGACPMRWLARTTTFWRATIREVVLSRRARAMLAELRDEHSFVDAGAGFTTCLVRRGPDPPTWWTFAGSSANASLAAGLAELVSPVASINGLRLQLRDEASASQLARTIADNRDWLAAAEPAVDSQAVDALKFSAAVPRDLATQMLARRLADPAAINATIGTQIRYVRTRDRSS